MQISTRSEDFVIDTLKLRIHVGPYLREAFKDSNKKKVKFLDVFHSDIAALLTYYCAY